MLLKDNPASLVRATVDELQAGMVSKDKLGDGLLHVVSLPFSDAGTLQTNLLLCSAHYKQWRCSSLAILLLALLP